MMNIYIFLSIHIFLEAIKYQYLLLSSNFEICKKKIRYIVLVTFTIIWTTLSKHDYLLNFNNSNLSFMTDFTLRCFIILKIDLSKCYNFLKLIEYCKVNSSLAPSHAKLMLY